MQWRRRQREWKAHNTTTAHHRRVYESESSAMTVQSPLMRDGSHHHRIIHRLGSNVLALLFPYLLCASGRRNGSRTETEQGRMEKRMGRRKGGGRVAVTEVISDGRCRGVHCCRCQCGVVESAVQCGCVPLCVRSLLHSTDLCRRHHWTARTLTPRHNTAQHSTDSTALHSTAHAPSIHPSIHPPLPLLCFVPAPPVRIPRPCHCSIPYCSQATATLFALPRFVSSSASSSNRSSPFVAHCCGWCMVAQ